MPATLRADLAEALGIDHRMIHRGLPLAAASTGLWSVFVPLLDAVILDGLEPDLTRVHALSDALGVGSIYAYAPMGVNRFAARDFAPALGIPEDPVTGSAGGALMALLASQGRLPVRGERACGLVYQGHALGTPARSRWNWNSTGSASRRSTWAAARPWNARASGRPHARHALKETCTTRHP